MRFMLRPARESDVPLIRELAARIWTACYATLLTPEQRDYMLRWMYAPQQLTGQIRRGVHFHIVEVQGRPVGYLAWEVLQGGITAHLHKLYLEPAVQGCGLGQQLLREVMQAAASGGCRHLELRVNRGNVRALRAYHRAGFATVEAVVTDIGGGFVMDDYILRTPLSPTA
ncbi:MAG: GNAT family N-acetyltransferase [Verrucomicrobia bacterium]|nr:GNAT family N-acetyltransferase [Verrucomicrobiota bacterium]